MVPNRGYNWPTFDGVRKEHIRQRSPSEWRADIEANRMNAMVALDALKDGVLGRYPSLAEMVPWLVRLAIEERKLTAKHGHRRVLPRRFNQTWEYRSRVSSQNQRIGRGDVFCLFCCEPIHTDMPERHKFGDLIIDYGKTAVVMRHTTPCALLHLAGLRPMAPWGSVAFPDPDSVPL